MARTKTTAKRMRTETSRAPPSSSAGPSRPPQLEGHPLLQFSREGERVAYSRHTQKPYVEGRYFDWDVLRAYGVEAEIQTLLDTGAWRAFFGITHPTYRELTLEVLSTFSLVQHFTDVDRSDLITFRLGGRRHRMSVTEFSVHMGLYSPEFVVTDDYRQLLVELPRGTFPSSVWSLLTGGLQPDYNPRHSKASQFTSLSLRIIHAVLARTLTGRGHSRGVVSNDDAFYLWSLHMQRPIHLGLALARHFHHQATHKKCGSIAIGPYVTQLADQLGLLQQHLPTLSRVMDMHPLTESALRSMHIHRPGPQPALPEEDPMDMMDLPSDAEEEAPEGQAPEPQRPDTHDMPGPSGGSSQPDYELLRADIAAMQTQIADLQHQFHQQQLADRRHHLRTERQMAALFAHFGLEQPPSPPQDE